MDQLETRTNSQPPCVPGQKASKSCHFILHGSGVPGTAALVINAGMSLREAQPFAVLHTLAGGEEAAGQVSWCSVASTLPLTQLGMALL